MIQRWNIEGDEVTPDDRTGVYVLWAHVEKDLRFGGGMYRVGFADGLRATGCTEQTVKIRLAELENKP